MSWLKKLGGILAKTGAVVASAYGIVSPYIPQDKRGKADDLFGAIGTDIGTSLGIIATVEAIGQVTGLNGPDKLKAAAPLIGQAILASSALAKHKVANEALFAQACVKLADGYADLANSLHEDGAQGDDVK